MKALRGMSTMNYGLSYKQLRAVEQALGIYLDKAVNGFRTNNQQFAVYDEDDRYVGDIVADTRWFREDELRAKIKIIFEQ